MTTANIITVFRIMLVPIFLVFLLTKMPNSELIAFIIFALAAISDGVDGWIARKFNQISEVGKFLDPLEDKLLIAGALVALTAMDRVETWVAAIIILREIFITAFRFYFLFNKKVFSASTFAKKKTFFQILAIGLLIIYPKLPDPDAFFIAAKVLLYISVFLAVYSGIEYMVKFSRLSKHENPE
jgi:CDP-diacylglycerol--glycerol-3-phosphate 3-phosphatidyltransferase